MIPGIGDLQRIPGTQRLLPEPGRPEAAMGEAFAEMVTRLASTTITRLETAEAVSLQGLKGEAATRDVVDALLSAEQVLQASISILDTNCISFPEISCSAIVSAYATTWPMPCAHS